ncbi:hypothetical protein HDE_01915 [Halotydeus destructor]|nr:hypothetical protein HDE_01915 [Halotydeus destructor]
MNIAYRKLISIIFTCACAGGLLFQLATLNQQYFKYKTFTRLSMEIVTLSQSPDLHICPATNQVFNRTAYNSKASKKLGKLVGASAVLSFQSTMTVGQLLEYSPSGDDLIHECLVRRPGGLEFRYLEKQECNKAFNVTKYYTLEYICYHVALVPLDGEPLYNNDRLNLAINYPGVYFELTLEDRWQQSIESFRILSVQREYGGESLTLSPIVSRGLENGAALYSFFLLSNYKIHYDRLPPPYDTKCRRYRDEGYHSSTDCENKCKNKRSLSEVNRFWYGSRGYYPTEQRPLSTYDMRNATLARIMGRINGQCERACAQLDCHVTWVITTVITQRQPSGISFSAVAAKQPSFFISHEAQQTFESYVIFAMSCIGSWLGLSVLSFNPVAFMAKAPWRATGTEQNGGSELSIDVKKGVRYLLSLVQNGDRVLLIPKRRDVPQPRYLS